MVNSVAERSYRRYVQAIVICVGLQPVGLRVSGAADPPSYRLIEFHSGSRFVGRTGQLIGVPFRASIVVDSGVLTITHIGGVKLEVPVVYKRDEHDGLRSSVDTVAWETGGLVGSTQDLANGEQSTDRRLRFRSRLWVIGNPSQRDVRSKPGESLKDAIATIDLGENVKIKGRFGAPMGKWLRIVGQWRHNPDRGKDRFDQWSFQVIRVNDTEFGIRRPDERDVVNALPEFGLHDVTPDVDGIRVEPLDGQTWHLEAYEVFNYHGVPEDVQRVFGFDAAGANTPYGPYSELRWRLLEISETKQQ